MPACPACAVELKAVQWWQHEAKRKPSPLPPVRNRPATCASEDHD